ncbi:hypothetical protein AMS68_002221 [Peltaster fructicola]|uniref:Enoyl reductase (ER) domain-containing protein n=1 Tax=Peltaster fructicola TaxID=286661 RepID=A0A6H0XPP9_9PEZI|nr:hypothetical protein AMS68_002221 [Peltaster fructicola]
MTNQAAWLDEKGSRLRVGDAQEAKAGHNEVVIKNHAIAINPVDWKQQDNGWFIKQYPVILGCDISGEITEVGSGVSKFKAGDRVIGHCTALGTGDNKNGAYQLYSVLPGERVAKIPSSMSFEQAAVLPLAISTAADGLYKSASEGMLGLPYPTADTKPSNKVLVVYGGSSSVGAITIQLATASGARVIALASERNFQFDSDVVDKVVNAVQKLGGDFVGVYDAISLEDQSYHITVPILDKLGKGNLAVTLPPPKQSLKSGKAGNVFAITKTTDPVWNDFVEPALASGKLRAIPPPLVVGSGLEAVQKGCDENKKGVSAKKVVIKL